MSYYKDLTGQKIGRLTVVCRDYSSERGVIWKCVCDCGNYKSLPSYLLNAKNGSRSCGCLRKEISYKDGRAKTKLYKVWISINQRCYNPNDRTYKNYGGRGIGVCEEWKNDYVAFRDWSIRNGYIEDTMPNGKNRLTIDRIDNNGDYAPNNCRWITMKEQCKNRRSNHLVTINGETKPMVEWAEIHNIQIGTIWNRIKLGKSGEDLIKPVKKHKERNKK